MIRKVSGNLTTGKGWQVPTKNQFQLAATVVFPSVWHKFTESKPLLLQFERVRPIRLTLPAVRGIYGLILRIRWTLSLGCRAIYKLLW